jgi:predicted AAA+ superfamily ATPase
MFNDTDIIRLIKDFNESELPKPLYNREVELPLDIPINRAISVIGPRRAGKSYTMFVTINKLLAKGIEKSRIIYINFDSPIFIGSKAEEVKRILDIYFTVFPDNFGKKIWIFLDEVQLIDNWEIFVRNLVDNSNFKVYISGSSSKLLSKDIATHLRGRTISYVILPLSFREVLEFENILYDKYLSTKDESKIVNKVTEYLGWGGYPETILYVKEREKILKEIIDVTIQKDIAERYGIRNQKILRLLISGLANSSEFSIYKFSNFLKSNGHKVSKNTLYTYFEALTDAFVIYPIRKNSGSYKAKEQSRPKVYFVDNGLLRINGIASEGKLLENTVLLNLIRKFGEDAISYYSSNLEVDFVIKIKNKVKHLIQVSYDLSNFDTKDRELKALHKSSEDLKCNDLTVITFNSEAVEDYKGKKIKVIPLYKWLLD